jgi:hypothetical protein
VRRRRTGWPGMLLLGACDRPSSETARSCATRTRRAAGLLSAHRTARRPGGAARCRTGAGWWSVNPSVTGIGNGPITGPTASAASGSGLPPGQQGTGVRGCLLRGGDQIEPRARAALMGWASGRARPPRPVGQGRGARCRISSRRRSSGSRRAGSCRRACPGSPG